MKFVIAPDSFKGTLTATEVAAAIAAAIKKRFPTAKTLLMPIADGGEGSLDCIASYLPGERVPLTVCGPYGTPVLAEYLRTADGTAIIETAKAVGLYLAPEQKNIFLTTTYGVGELIADAVRRGANHIVLALGGSATSDAGLGMLRALGLSITRPLDIPARTTASHMQAVRELDFACLDTAIGDVSFTAMCDVDAVPYGKCGAAYVFGPQKGAAQEELPHLDAGIQNITRLYGNARQKDFSALAGGGAAGGLGLAAYAGLNATLKPGIEVVLELADFDRHLLDAAYVVTGEGRLDEQSLMGKAVAGITRRALRQGVPVIAVCGTCLLDKNALRQNGIAAVIETNKTRRPFEEIKETARADLVLALDAFFSAF